MIVPEWLLDETKAFSVRFPYSPTNEKFSKVFMRRVENFTNDKVKVIIIWNTRKDKVKHHSCVIYRGTCSCGADYIGETIRNSEIRWNEHSTGKDKFSDCVKYLNDHFGHECQWFVLFRPSKNCLKHKILEASTFT